MSPWQHTRIYPDLTARGDSPTLSLSQDISLRIAYDSSLTCLTLLFLMLRSLLLALSVVAAVSAVATPPVYHADGQAMFASHLDQFTATPAAHQPIRGHAANVRFNSTVMLCWLNRVRADSNLPPLGQDSRLIRAAQLHSVDMAQMERLTQTGSDGSSFGDRATREHYDWIHIAENIADYTASVANEKRIFDLWMRGGGATDNMLSTDNMAFGVAAAVGDDGMLYATAMFGREYDQYSPVNVPQC